MREHESDRYGKDQKVIFLNSESGVTLDSEVENDKMAEDSNRKVAFVQGHRYAPLSDLTNNPNCTTDLE